MNQIQVLELMVTGNASTQADAMAGPIISGLPL
jgi:hypothetical protein